MPYLLRTEVGNSLDIKEVPEAQLIIGRGANSHLRLDHEAVAFEHARIQQENGSYLLIDQRSVTGTYLNGKQVERASLSNGDRITIGPFLLDVHFSGKIEEPLALGITRVAPSGEPQRGEIKSRRFDYAAAYALNRKFLSKTTLTLLSTLGGIIVLFNILFAGKTPVFRPGGLSDAHSLFANECVRCHVPWHGPSEQACQDCHAGPLHHKDQAFTPSCMSCHPEHQERRLLKRVKDENCVQCHADLKTKGNKPSNFERNIADFSRRHPEFAIVVKTREDGKRLRLNDVAARRSDSTKISLNHESHLKPGLKSPKGSIQLLCRDCHIPTSDGMLMGPVSYQAHCKECHELGFDDRFPNRQVPHGSPEIVRAYLLRVYAEFQGEMLPYAELPRRLPGPTPSSTLNPSIIENVRKAQAHLYTVTCKLCHELSQIEGQVPVVEKPDMPVIWFANSRFSHKAHRLLACVSCHADVFKSKETADVLLPGIETCRNCHRNTNQDALFQKASAPTDCAACHTYHDKSKDQNWDGPYRVKLPFRLEKVRPRARSQAGGDFR